MTVAAMGQPERLDRKEIKHISGAPPYLHTVLFSNGLWTPVGVPPVSATVAVDMAPSRAPGGRTLEDVLMHGQD